MGYSKVLFLQRKNRLRFMKRESGDKFFRDLRLEVKGSHKSQKEEVFSFGLVPEENVIWFEVSAALLCLCCCSLKSKPSRNVCALRLES